MLITKEHVRVPVPQSRSLPSDAALARREALRETLLHLALQTIDTHGYQALRARALTDAAGCALGALYTVFQDMDALFIAAKLKILEQLDDDMANNATVGSGVSSQAPPILEPAAATTHLLALADAYLTFANTHFHRWQTLFQHRLGENTPLPEAYFERLTHIFGHIERPLGVIMPQSSTSSRALTSRALFASVHGIVVLGLEQRLGETSAASIRAQYQMLVRNVVAGLLADTRSVAD